MNTDRLWLSRFAPTLPDTLKTPLEVAHAELAAFPELSVELCLQEDMHEQWAFEKNGNRELLRGGMQGLLYGAYTLIFSHLSHQTMPDGIQSPAYPLRMLNCWDNLSGRIERGYAGRSLFFEDGSVSYDPDRIRTLARLLASCGINTLCINNVNVVENAQRLMEDLLPDVASLAALFRPFGIRLMLSCDFALPLRHGLSTADPLDSQVQDFWRDRAALIWEAIPDLAGFVVKADSEHRPGPFTYGRTHADGANMLARAVKPFGGIIVWRAFVYNCQQDWRDTVTDRPKAAYETYMSLDGAFDDNVILQIKNGPYDFQVREPVSPALLGMHHTHLAMELQLTQEYTGQQIDLFSMPPMWEEIFCDLPPERIGSIAAVANFGRDRCIVGHPFAAVNLYGYGRIAWDPHARAEDIIRTWCTLTYPSFTLDACTKLTDLLLGSRRVYEKYTSPLALCWMVVPHIHYGPSPLGYEFTPWGTFNRADRDAVGIDRTSKGTGYVLQYPPALRELYEDPKTCPEYLLLFFHRVRYDAVMKDGRTLIQRIYDDHFEGYEEVEAMENVLQELYPLLPPEDRELVSARIALQKANAREWRDVVNTFFHRLSGMDDLKHRKIYD